MRDYRKTRPAELNAEERRLVALEDENDKLRRAQRYGGRRTDNIAWLLEHASENGRIFNDVLHEAIGEYRCKIETTGA